MTSPVPVVRRAVGASLALVTTLGLATACGTATEAAAPGSTGTAITVTDQRPAEVTLDAPAETIPSAVIPAPAIIAAVDGSWDRIVGVNQSLIDASEKGIITRIFPEVLDTAVIAGRDFVPDMEEILALDPDVAVQWGYLGDDFIAPIEDSGIPVIGLEYGTQDDLETWIDLFGDVIGKSDRADDIIDWMHTEADDVTAQVESLGAEPVTGLSLSYSSEGISVSTETDYIQYVFDITGVTNAAASAEVTDGVASAEQIIAWDPDFIILSAFDEATPEDFYADERFADLQAVKDHRVYRAPLGVYRWQVPSAESPLFWNWVAALAYPGEYSVDLRAEMTDAIEMLYNYTLTDDDIALTLRTDINAASANYDAVSE